MCPESSQINPPYGIIASSAIEDSMLSGFPGNVIVAESSVDAQYWI
jgi:hypothetical protein